MNYDYKDPFLGKNQDTFRSLIANDNQETIFKILNVSGDQFIGDIASYFYTKLHLDQEYDIRNCI